LKPRRQPASANRSTSSFGNNPFDVIRQLLRDADSPQAECIAVVCTNLAATSLVEEMERELGKPIIDSIAVTFWKGCMLRRHRAEDRRLGRADGRNANGEAGSALWRWHVDRWFARTAVELHPQQSLHPAQRRLGRAFSFGLQRELFSEQGP
jgi:hypothetical protein